MKMHDLENILPPLVESLGYSLWGFEYIPAGKKSVLRIYIEGPSPDAGATIDQCVEVSRHVSTALDVEDIIPGSYNLEVSSPGLERLFFKPGQMQGYIGRKVEILLKESLISPPKDEFKDRKKYKGVLTGLAGDDPVVEVDGVETTIPWNTVKKARLVYDFDADRNKKPSGK